MTKWGLTEKGFRRKTYAECLQDRVDRAREKYGANIDTSETSFLGTFIRNTAWDEALLWEVLEDIYLSAFINYSEGTSLDSLSSNIARRPATKAKGVVIFSGDNETQIPKGFQVKNSRNIIYETTESGIIKNGKVEIPVQSIEAGKHTNSDIETVDIVVNPLKGLDSIINEVVIEGGRDKETDLEFRERIKQSHSKGGGSTVDAIRAALLDIDEVVDAQVRENTSMEEVDGIPPKSVHCIVHGAEDDVVAKTIFENKAGGIQAFGNTYVTVEDLQGQDHKIGFTRAKVKEVWVNLKVEREEGFKGEDVVKRAVINYIGGLDGDGISYKGLPMGADVAISRVMASVICLGGVKDLEVTLSIDGEEYKAENIEVEQFETAETNWDNVVVSYV